MAYDTSSVLRDRTWLPLFAAWVVALASALSALFIGEIMGQAPCNLCWYQRAFMFPLAILLAVAAWRSDSQARVYGLALAIPGLALAAFHSLVYEGILSEAIAPCGDRPSCSGSDMTVFGTLPLPLLSVVAFFAITMLLSVIPREASR